MKNTIKSAMVVSAIGVALVSGAGAAAADTTPAYPPAQTTPPVVSATVQVAGTVVTTPSKPAPQVAGTVATKPVAEAQGQLAFTGADVLPYGIGGGALVLLGAGALVLGRKRRA
ncbi:MAG: hypothetical protein ABI181_00915 [Mycobacteriaceae bacterium]